MRELGNGKRLSHCSRFDSMAQSWKREKEREWVISDPGRGRKHWPFIQNLPRGQRDSARERKGAHGLHHPSEASTSELTGHFQWLRVEVSNEVRLWGPKLRTLLSLYACTGCPKLQGHQDQRLPTHCLALTLSNSFGLLCPSERRESHREIPRGFLFPSV